MTGVSVVLVEDDEPIGASLSKALRGHGYVVGWARSGGEALAIVDDFTAVVILDLGLPDVDGVDLCRSLRARHPATEILMLTARRDEVDVIVGLDAGAADYVVKPFGLAELLACIRVCARRRPPREVLLAGDLTVELDSYHVSVRGVEVQLTVKEFELLTLLSRRVGEVVRRTELVESVWGESSPGAIKSLDTHIWSLRRKLELVGHGHCLRTIRGVGYRLDAA